MSIKGYIFGHQIYWDGNAHGWRYSDTDAFPTKEKEQIRKCPKCDMLPTNDGHDPCIANLPNVKFACCGHGVDQAYVAFTNGTPVIRGEEAIEHLKSVIDAK